MSRVDGLARFLSQRAPRANGSPLHVSLTLRAVDAFGAPWREVVEETFADFEGVREVLFSLPMPEEPSVLRAEVHINGRYAVFGRLSGDWLCDPVIADAPVFLGRTAWPRWADEIAPVWADGRPWLDAWDLCPEGAWALDFTGFAGVPYRLRQRAAVACGWALAERAGAGAHDCRRLIALVQECIDDPDSEGGRAPVSSRAYRAARDAMQDVPRGQLNASEAYAVHALNRMAQLLILRPESWTPAGAWETAFRGLPPLIHRSRQSHAAERGLAQVVRDLVPASVVLRGLALQGIGERRDVAPGVVE